MSAANQSESKQPSQLNRTEILKAVVADAESMGLRNRDRIEWLTNRVIERLEQQSPSPLPGMEHLVSKQYAQRKRQPSKSEIQAIVKKILAEEVQPGEEPAMPVEREAGVTPVINLSDNALRVLERRYLKKDKQGQVIETPEEMFRRVARAIAAAELIYD